MNLSHRERVLKAVNHQKPDRVPRDLGGAFTSSIASVAYENLADFLGLDLETRLMRKWARVVHPDEKILRHFDIDTRMVVPRYDEGWNEYWKIAPVENEDAYIDEWGIKWSRPESKMGPYFMTTHPLADIESVDELENFIWPDPEDPARYEGLEEQARRLKNETDYAVIGVFPRPIVSLSQFMRGYEKWFLDFMMNRELLEAIMDIIVETNLRIGKNILDRIGKYIDLAFFHDDLATQQSLMVSPEHYREIIKPRHKKLFDLVKTHSDAKIIYHTDGAVFPILEDFIEIGVDALNPVQTSAQGMDGKALSSSFGDRLCFWGAIESQKVLPTGTPEEVFEEVKRQISDLGKNGNYVLGACHNIQDDVSPENVIAMFEAADRFGIYD